ncbi:hypothetical protein [Paraburkholderia sp. 2C]
MATDRPPLHSFWENRAGEKIFVEEVTALLTEEEIASDLDAEGLTGKDFEREAAAIRAMFVVTYVAYEGRGNPEVVRFETDEAQWARLTGPDGFRIKGIEPPRSIMRQPPGHG